MSRLRSSVNSGIAKTATAIFDSFAVKNKKSRTGTLPVQLNIRSNGRFRRTSHFVISSEVESQDLEATLCILFPFFTFMWPTTMFMHCILRSELLHIIGFLLRRRPKCKCSFPVVIANRKISLRDYIHSNKKI